MEKLTEEHYLQIPGLGKEFSEMIEQSSLPDIEKGKILTEFHVYKMFCELVIVELEQQDTKIENLTNLQEELGYVKGEISTVAMLGLVGEAGEVLSEIHTVSNLPFYSNLQNAMDVAVAQCKELEDYKKLIRKEDKKFVPVLSLHPDKISEFDSELSDCFYYLNILATNRGLTIFDLAQMAHDKVRAKQAAGGSSEDPKTT